MHAFAGHDELDFQSVSMEVHITLSQSVTRTCSHVLIQK